MLLLVTGALLLGANGPAAGQLAQAPWPMFQHDVRHTGRARFGPLFLSGALAPVNVSVWQSWMITSPTIAPDGAIYVGVDAEAGRPLRGISAPSSRT
jgi:hypothetical protein